MYALLVTYGTVSVGVGVGVLLYGTDGNRLYHPFGPSVKKKTAVVFLLSFLSFLSFLSLLSLSLSHSDIDTELGVGYNQSYLPLGTLPTT